MAADLSRELTNAKEKYEEALRKKGIVAVKEYRRFAKLYLKWAETSLLTASALHDVSQSSDLKKALRLADSYDGNAWTIVASYYSMFYVASALVALKDLKVVGGSSHLLTKSAFLRLYIENKVLAARLGLSYDETERLAPAFLSERENRERAQYEIAASVIQRDAERSLENARSFFEKIRPLIERSG